MKYIIEQCTGFIHGISWPLAAVIIAGMLRTHLFSFFNRIQEIEAGPVKLKLNKLLSNSRKQAKNAKTGLSEKINSMTAGQEKEPGIFSVSEQAALIADISPLAAIPFAYSRLLSEIIRELPAIYDMETEINFADDVILDLFKAGKIEKNIFALFNTVKSVNDEVLLNKNLKLSITKQEAIEYSKIIEMLISVIDEHREI